jgi:hypothetical protein
MYCTCRIKSSDKFSILYQIYAMITHFCIYTACGYGQCTDLFEYFQVQYTYVQYVCTYWERIKIPILPNDICTYKYHNCLTAWKTTVYPSAKGFILWPCKFSLAQNVVLIIYYLRTCIRADLVFFTEGPIWRIYISFL